MSVFLGAGGKVLLGTGGKVATSSDCCCGGCTFCSPLFVGPPCSVVFGEYWTIQNCDGSCSGEMFTDPFASFMHHIAWCTTTGEDCAIQSINCETSRNTETCEDTLVGPCDGICPDGQTIIDGVSVLWVLCPELSPPP